MKYDYKYINNLIDKKVEESLKLEFKRGESISDTKEMSKDISSMANSAGGVIVYGLEEINHIASKLSFINGNEYTKEWLENVIGSNIHRKIDGILIHPIRIEDNFKKSIYVIEVPESTNSPHMAKDKKFYKRHNFKNLPMEEYEIRSLYFKSSKPELVLDSLLITKDFYLKEIKGEEILYCSPIFQILNKGKGVSLHHKIILHSSRNYRASYSYNALGSTIKCSESLLDDNTYLITIYDKTPIFPGEIVGIGKFNISFPKSFISHDVKEENGSEIKVEIVYDGGKDTSNRFVNDFYPLQFVKEFL